MFVLWLVVIWISVVEISYLESVSVVVDYNDLDREVEKQCIEHCHLQNQTDGTRLDYNCNNECNTEQCSKGCVVWKDSLTSSCHRACNGTSDRLSHRELHCVIGCNDAIGKYFARVRTVLGKPPAPALLDNSLTATTLKLEWRFKEASRARLSAHLQWRYEEIAATWQYCRNVTWEPEISSFYVQTLQPYTKYRFRIALNLGRHNFGADAIYSERSVVIATLAAGPPASPPQHVHAAPVDAHSVSVTWEPGPFPHGPLLSYVLHITETGSSGRPGYQGRTEVKVGSSSTTIYYALFASFSVLFFFFSYSSSVLTKNRITLSLPFL